MFVRFCLPTLLMGLLWAIPMEGRATAQDTIFVRLAPKPARREDTTSQWLKQFLRHRGFRIAHRLQKIEGALAIHMEWPNPNQVRLRCQKTSRLFRVSPAMRDPWLRARTVSNYIDFFLEQVLEQSRGKMRKRWEKAKEQLRDSLPTRSPLPRSTFQPKEANLGTVSMVEAPVASPKREEPPPPRRIVAKPKRPAPKAKPAPRRPTPQPRMRTAPNPPKALVRRSPPPPARKPKRVAAKPKVRRAKPVVVRPPPKRIRRVALGTGIVGTIQPRPTPSERQVRLFVDVGASVGGPTIPGVLLGGELGLGVSIKEWRIGLQGSVEGFVGGDDLQVLVVRPTATVGLPYLKFANAFRLSLDAGGGLEAIRAVFGEQEQWRFRGGFLAQALLLWNANSSISAYARLSFFISPQFYLFEDDTETLADLAAYKFSLQIGIRFYGL